MDLLKGKTPMKAIIILITLKKFENRRNNIKKQPPDVFYQKWCS